MHVPVIPLRKTQAQDGSEMKIYVRRKHMGYNPVTEGLAARVYNPRKHGPNSLEAQIYNMSRTRDGIDSSMQFQRMREA